MRFLSSIVITLFITLLIISCNDEGDILKQEPIVTQQKKELIDSIYSTWILYGIGYSVDLWSTSIENATQTQICDFINTNLDNISIGYELKIIKKATETTIDKIYNCGESWIYNSASLNINVLNDSEARIEEYVYVSTLINYHISFMETFKDNKLFLRVEYDHRTPKKYFLMYKKKT